MSRYFYKEYHRKSVSKAGKRKGFVAVVRDNLDGKFQLLKFTEGSPGSLDKDEARALVRSGQYNPDVT